MDRVFRFTGIVVSAFCDATVQIPPYVACGRAGNGLLVLEPKLPMAPSQLAYIASYINLAVKWRFSWYWQVTLDRLKVIEVQDVLPEFIPFDISAELPNKSSVSPRGTVLKVFSEFALEDLFDMQPGSYHNLSDLAPGRVPVISCGEQNNGIAGHYTVTKHVFENKLTVAFNGSTLTAKYHPYRFAAKDDVAVCTPKKPLELTTQLFIMVRLNGERWRYSYYRKCYMGKLRRFRIKLPTREERIDEVAIKNLVEQSPYWKYLSTKLRLHEAS